MAVSEAETLERIYLRFALCESDSQLQSFTNKHLIEIIAIVDKNPLFLEKAKELLSHYNTRVRNNLTIYFPVEGLVDILMNGGILARNLVLIYLRMARNRLTDEKHLELLPGYIDGLNKKISDTNLCYEVLGLALPGFVVLSKLDLAKWPQLSIADNVVNVILRFFYCIVVYKNDKLKSASQEALPLSTIEQDMVEKLVGAENTVFVNNETKVALLNVASGLFKEEEYFPLAVIAAGIENDNISSAADSMLRKLDIQKCVDSPTVIASLMNTFLGDKGSKAPPAQQVSPAPYSIKCKILAYLCRSAIAPTSYMNNVKICLQGIDKTGFPKLQSGSLLFLIKIIEKMSATALNTLGPSIFSRLFAISAETENSQCLELVYRSLGALGKAHQVLVLNNMNVVTELFQSISLKSENVAYSVVEALTDWLPAFCQAQDEKILTQLKQLVSSFVQHENAKCRLIALKYVEALLSSEEMDIKWILLLAAGDSRDEMKKEASRLLDLSLKKNAIPSLNFIVDYIWKKVGADILDANKKEVHLSKQTFLAETYQMCSRYLWAVCEANCGLEPDLRIIEGDDHWMTAAPQISQMLLTVDKPLLERMTYIVLQAVKQPYDVHFFRIAACFISVNPISDMPLTIEACCQRARDSSRGELSSCAAFVACTLMTPKARSDCFEQSLALMEKTGKPGLCWLAASSLACGNLAENVHNAGQFVELLVQKAEQEYNSATSLLEGVLGCLSLILKAYHKGTMPLDLPSELLDKVFEICKKVAGSRRDSLSTKAREFAVSSLGFIPHDPSDISCYEKVLKSLYEIADGPPQPELHFTVGASIWDAIVGYNSSSRRQVYLKAETDIKMSDISLAEQEVAYKRFEDIANTILDQKLVSSNHHIRRSAIVWLMVLLQRACACDADCLAGLLDRIQEGFAEGLTESDDFTQDIASRGMGIVYQIATPEQKKSLVSGLMNSLVEGRQSTAKVHGGTVLFKEGQLGKSPDGSNLTTYKELCSLATDLNQPDLVYKFMQLAKHNATWNSKKGAAFGFSAVFEQAREELDPFVGQLVPKLFRYRYDPDMKVQQSMKSIWTVITQRQRNVIDQYADEIVKELKPQLTNREWRVRESACLALSDLLRGHDTPFMHTIIPELLEIVFRVKDDVKESVRLAADKAGEAIMKIILRQGQSSSKEKANAFLGHVLPAVIEKGVHSSIPANKQYSLYLLVELAKTAGSQLKPYLAILVPCLLDAISGSENQVLNYMAVRSNTDQLEALDDARAKMARMSPMMTAISDLIPHINREVLIELQPKFCDQLRASVGVSTRAATSQVVTQLCLRCPQLMIDSQLVCDKLFAALLPGIRDRNPSIRKNFANCLSYLAKFVSIQQMNGLIKLIARDLISEDQEMKEASKHILKNMVANCPELLGNYASRLVPYVFLETCAEVIKGDDISKKKHEDWSELWNEMVPSTDAAIRLHRNEVLLLAVETLQNNAVWAVRAQAARMLSKTVLLAKDCMTIAESDAIVTTILPLLSGRLWDGKAQVLDALGAVIDASGDRFQNYWEQDRIKEVLTVIKREASKRNKDYSGVGMGVAATFAHRMANIEAAVWIIERVQGVVERILNPEDQEISSGSEDLTNFERESINAKFASVNLIALVRSLAAYRNGTNVNRCLNMVAGYICNHSLYWNVRQEMFAALLQTVQIWELDTPISVTCLVNALFQASTEMYNEQRKTISSQCLQIIVKMAEKRVIFLSDWNSILNQMAQLPMAIETGLVQGLEALLMQ